MGIVCENPNFHGNETVFLWRGGKKGVGQQNREHWFQFCTEYLCSIWSALTCYSLSGVALIATFCINIAFSRCCTHFRCITICKITEHWLNKLWLLLCHWTLDLLANSMSSCSWLCTPPPRHALKSSQWRAESGRQNKHANCCNFLSLMRFSTHTHPPVLNLIHAPYSW